MVTGLYYLWKNFTVCTNTGSVYQCTSERGSFVAQLVMRFELEVISKSIHAILSEAFGGMRQAGMPP